MKKIYFSIVIAKKQQELLNPIIEKYDLLQTNIEEKNLTSDTQKLVLPYFTAQKVELLNEKIEEITTKINILDIEKTKITEGLKSLDDEKQRITNKKNDSSVSNDISINFTNFFIQKFYFLGIKIR